MNLADADLLHLYRLVLLVAGAVGLYKALPVLWRLVARYREFPPDLRQAIRRGASAAVLRFVRQKWPGLMMLGFLLALLAGLFVATRLS